MAATKWRALRLGWPKREKVDIFGIKWIDYFHHAGGDGGQGRECRANVWFGRHANAL
jgi:hypothetical protein